MRILTAKGWALLGVCVSVVAVPCSAVFGPWALIPGGMLGAAAFVFFTYDRG